MEHKDYILIAEDDVEVRSLLQLYLESVGYGVIGVSNGVEAMRVLVDMWKDKLPSMLITNIEMPHMDGRLLLRILSLVQRQEIREMPVVIVTGDTHFFTDKYTVLRKPYSIEELLRIIDEKKIPH